MLQGWSYEDGKTTTDIFDYGEVLWSSGVPSEARLLDAVILKFGLRLVNPSIGRIVDHCFFGGYIDDVRFNRIRGEMYVSSCNEDGEASVKKWKVAQKFKSLWFAE